MNSTSLGKSIYLGLGPTLYLGFWILCASQTNNFDLNDSAVFLFSCLGLSILYLIMGFLTLKIHVICNVPTIKRNGVYATHAKFAWAYALTIALPASLWSVLSVSNSFPGPGGLSEYHLITVLIEYFIGWFLGGCFGAFFGYLILVFVVPIFMIVAKFIASPDTACTKEDQRV